MNAVVVYDSYFGNTQKIAEAVGKVLAEGGSVQVVAASQLTAAMVQGIQLLVVGSPTRSFGPTQGVTTFLKQMGPHGLDGVRVAAFDTRMALDKIDSGLGRWIVKTGGFAAKKISKQLVSKGGVLAAPPEGFTVDGEQGPLSEGELERAAAWATQIASSVVA